MIESGARFGQGYLLARPAFPLPSVTWPEEDPDAFLDRPTNIKNKPPLRKKMPTGRRR